MEDGFLTCLRERIFNVQRALLDVGTQIESLDELNLTPENGDSITNGDIRALQNLLLVCGLHLEKLAVFKERCSPSFEEEDV